MLRVVLLWTINDFPAYGVNFLVAMDVSYEPNAPLPVPIPSQVTTIRDAIGHQVLWLAQLVILTTHFIQVCALFLFYFFHFY